MALVRDDETIGTWGARVDLEGQELCGKAEWWKKLQTDEYRKGVDHRSRPSHYVFGKMSPMYIEQYYSTQKDHAVYAVYFGHQATNTRDVVQGGAICSVFDLLCAATATITQDIHCVTRAVNVEMIKPIPICSLVRAEAKVNAVEGKRVTIDAEMTDGNGFTYAKASIVHIAMNRNAKL